LTPGNTLDEALAVLVGHEGSGLPVLSHEDQQVIGWLDHRDVLLAYSARLRSGAQQAAGAGPLTSSASPPPQPPASRRPRRVSPRRPANQALGAFRVVDLELAGSGPPAGMTVAQVNWPASSHLLALRRGGDTIPVTPDTVLDSGDRLTLLVAAEHATSAADLLQEPSGAPPSAS
jgi:hypothetical protein